MIQINATYNCYRKDQIILINLPQGTNLLRVTFNI